MTQDEQTIKQVRELLFGEDKRETQTQLGSLEGKLSDHELLTNDRFASIEALIEERVEQLEADHQQSVAAIGQAIVQLGNAVLAMAGQNAPAMVEQDDDSEA